MGDGNINSPIMIIGEAPGEEEEKNRKNFSRRVWCIVGKNA
jgi:uracil-DNA glycosylase